MSVGVVGSTVSDVFGNFSLELGRELGASLNMNLYRKMVFFFNQTGA